MGEANELTYWVLLHGVPEVGPVTFRRLLDRFGTARAVIEEAGVEELASVRGVSRALAGRLAAARADLDRAERTVDHYRRRGARILRLSDPGYPRALHDLLNPPPLLYLFGEVTAADERAAGIVGTTKPSDKGRAIAEEFAARLGGAGVTVVSGFAHGIDAAAHRGAFRGGGRSVLCIPFGLRHYKSRPDFPPLAELSQRGAVLSECPPDQEWTGVAAIARDRIIAALSRAVFVVETRPRGGTMHTVAAAGQLGRPLFALQYAEPPESARGNSLLIARGATPLRRFGDLPRLIDRVDGKGETEG
jgi:DNA processing protein